MTHLFVLFGPPGVGKSYVGNILKNDFNFYFYDADADLTPALLDAIQKQQVFSQDLRDEYFAVVYDKIKALQKLYSNLAIAQAFAKESNRCELLTLFPEAKFILIETDVEIVNNRIIKRSDWVSIEYAEKIRNIFESPKLKHISLKNNEDRAHIHMQLAKLMEK